MQRIIPCSSPLFPQFAFEWHEGVGKVYLIVVPGKWEDGVFLKSDQKTAEANVLAEHCDTHARFLGFVQTFLRGYRMRIKDETLGIPKPANLPESEGCSPKGVST